MGWSDITLVLLNERQMPKSFLRDLHNKFEEINLVLEIDNYEFIVFNDTQDEKIKDPINLNNSMSVDEVISLICDWPGLGLLNYTHPKFKFSISINYRSWDDKLVDGFTIGFNGHEMIYKEKIKEQLILDIINLVHYKYVVGNIDNISNTYIDVRESLSLIIKQIENQKFEIDIRK